MTWKVEDTPCPWCGKPLEGLHLIDFGNQAEAEWACFECGHTTLVAHNDRPNVTNYWTVRRQVGGEGARDVASEYIAQMAGDAGIEI